MIEVFKKEVDWLIMKHGSLAVNVFKLYLVC